MAKSELDKLIRDINKKYRDEDAKRDVIQRGSEMAPINYIPCSSPAVGYILGTPGWPEGKLLEFFGQEGAGKSSLMYLAMRDCWEHYGKERDLALIDVEHRANKDWMADLGLPVEDMVIVQPEDAEDATDIMLKLIREGDMAAIGFDSIGAAMISKGHETFADQKALFGGSAQAMSRMVRAVAPSANLHATTIFMTNQLRADMEGFNRPMTPGGRAVKHMVSVRIYLRPGKKNERFYSRERIKEGDGELVGGPIVMATVKNSFGPPGRQNSTNFFFRPSQEHLDHVGFDVEADIARLGVLLGVVERKGPAWFAYEGVSERGRDPFFAKLKEEGKTEMLYKEVMKRIASTAIDWDAVEDKELRLPEAEGPEISDPEV